MIRLYSLLWYLAAPLIALWLVAVGLRDPAWWRGLRERLGLVDVAVRGRVWVHAASVGEVQAALPLVEALRERYPGMPIVLTAFTPSGQEHARRSLPADVHCALLPFDFPGAASRFVRRVHPRVAVVIETELWPNLYAACEKADIAVLLVSARITERSARRYRRWRGLVADTLRVVREISAQTEADAGRLLMLGADPGRVTVGGNLKFDLRIPPGVVERAGGLRDELGIGGRPVWIAASTHEGEDEQVLDAHRAVLDAHPDGLLVLAPRHPVRSDTVARAALERGFRTARRSSSDPCDAATDVYLLDTLGELTVFYAIADIAFVGGSLVPVGGHNLLEPAAFNLPLVCGPHLHGVREISALFEEEGGLEVVTSSESLARTVNRLFACPVVREQRGEAARRVLERNRGAVARIVRSVEAVLDESCSARCSDDVKQGCGTAPGA